MFELPKLPRFVFIVEYSCSVGRKTGSSKICATAMLLSRCMGKFVRFVITIFKGSENVGSIIPLWTKIPFFEVLDLAVINPTLFAGISTESEIKNISVLCACSTLFSVTNISNPTENGYPFVGVTARGPVFSTVSLLLSV